MAGGGSRPDPTAARPVGVPHSLPLLLWPALLTSLPSTLQGTPHPMSYPPSTPEGSAGHTVCPRDNSATLAITKALPPTLRVTLFLD